MNTLQDFLKEEFGDSRTVTLDDKERALLAELIYDWFDLVAETDVMGEPAPAHLKTFGRQIVKKLEQG